MNRILGIDFGKSRLGLAISDELGLLAHPLETVAAGKNALQRIVELVSVHKIDNVVVGIPRNMDGSVGPAATDALKFIEELRAAVPCKITTWDERLTTVAAHKALRDSGKKTHQTRDYVDQVAAQMILQGYLDRQQHAAHLLDLENL